MITVRQMSSTTVAGVRRFYEGLVRVPLIFRWPGKVKSQVRDGLVELTDIAPTLHDLVGLPMPDHFQGHSLAPVLRQGADGARQTVRCEFYDALDLPKASRATMWRRGRHKLVVYHGHGLGELFDLAEDPHEFNNLWDDPDHQTLKAELLIESFDALAESLPHGSPRVGPY